MADSDYFALDEETLRQIEAEAQAEAEAEFELDEETLKMIEKAALEEAGLEDIDLGDDFLDDLKLEVMTDDDMTVGDENLEDTAQHERVVEPVPAATPASAPAPTPSTPTPSAPDPVQVRVVEGGSTDATDDVCSAVQKAKREAYEKAKMAALDKRKNQVVAKARHAVRGKSHGDHGISSEMHQMEKQIVKKQGTLAIVGIVAGLIVLFAVVAIGAIIALSMKSDTPIDGPTRTYKKNGQSTDNINTARAGNDVEATKLLNTVSGNFKKMRKGAGLSKEGIQAELDRIAELREKYPDYATKREERIAELESQLKTALEMYADPGS